MSDIRKWIKLAEGLAPNTIVDVDKRHGGGVASVVSSTADDVTIKIAGGTATMTVGANDVKSSIGDGNIFGKEITPMETFVAGQVIYVDHLYGVGNGKGFGVFVAYSLTGDTAIVDIDGKPKLIPVQYLTPALEMTVQDAPGVTDGSLSPMSNAMTDTINKEDSMSNDFNKWSKIVSDAMGTPGSEQHEPGCDCTSCAAPSGACQAGCECEACGGSEIVDDVSKVDGLEVVDIVGGKSTDEIIKSITDLLSQLSSKTEPKSLSEDYELEGALESALSELGYDLSELHDAFDDIIDQLEMADAFEEDFDNGGYAIDQDKLNTVMKSFGVEPMLAPIGEASMDDLDAEEEASLRSQAEYDKYHASHDDEDDGLDFSKFTGKKKEIDPSNIKSTPVTDEHEELMRMIAEIGHAQDIGASKAMIKNRAGEDVQMRYDVNKLQAMPSSSIRKIHAKVIGESEEIVEAVEDEIDSDMADWLEYLKRSIK